MSTINWSGRTWQVRNTGLSDPGPNRFARSLVTVDASGHLHLKIAKTRHVWQCSEIHHEHALGFGTYKFRVLSDMRAPAFDPQATLGLFTYDWEAVHDGAGEVDIEFARWGVAEDPNDVEFSVQPADLDPAARNKRLPIGAPPYECTFVWKSTEISFSVLDGAGASHRFTDTRSLPHPPSATTWPFINLWLNQGRAPASAKPVQAVLESFHYTSHDH